MESNSKIEESAEKLNLGAKGWLESGLVQFKRALLRSPQEILLSNGIPSKILPTNSWRRQYWQFLEKLSLYCSCYIARVGQAATARCANFSSGKIVKPYCEWPSYCPNCCRLLFMNCQIVLPIKLVPNTMVGAFEK